MIARPLSESPNFAWYLLSWFIKLSVKTFKSIIVIYREGNFVYHHWGCASIKGHFLITLDLYIIIIFYNELIAALLNDKVILGLICEI